MKRLFLFGMLTAGLLWSGCKKENPVIDNGFSRDNYSAFYRLFLDPLKASLKTYMVFSSSGIYTPPDSLSSITAGIEGNREPFRLSINEQSINFPDYYYSDGDDFSQADTFLKLNEFYGKQFDFSFADGALLLKSDGSMIYPVAKLIIPKMLYPVVFENLTADDKVTSGTTITWSEDAFNEHGILIVIEYYPETQSDPDNRINFPEYRKVGKVVEDIGSYTFSESDFKGFPQNADLGFSLERVAFTTFPDDKGDACTFVNQESVHTGFTISIGE